MVSLTLPDNIFYQLFLPFTVIFVILFGIMTTMKIFDKRMSMVISVIIALIVLGSGRYSEIMKYVSGGGMIVIVGFIAVFIVLVALFKQRGGK